MRRSTLAVWILRVAGLAVLASVAAAPFALSGSPRPIAQDPPRGAAPSVEPPTLDDARKAAAEELKLLPSDAKQVACAPGMETAPPYTRPSRGIARIQEFILADGRCFEWVGSDPNEVIEAISGSLP
jgi:hypothetical protein